MFGPICSFPFAGNCYEPLCRPSLRKRCNLISQSAPLTPTNSFFLITEHLLSWGWSAGEEQTISLLTGVPTDLPPRVCKKRSVKPEGFFKTIMWNIHWKSILRIMPHQSNVLYEYRIKWQRVMGKRLLFFLSFLLLPSGLRFSSVLRLLPAAHSCLWKLIISTRREKIVDGNFYFVAPRVEGGMGGFHPQWKTKSGKWPKVKSKWTEPMKMRH